MMMGMAARMGSAPAPTAVTARAVVVVDDWIKTVPSTPTLSPTQGAPCGKLDNSVVRRSRWLCSLGHRAAGRRELLRNVPLSGFCLAPYRFRLPPCTQRYGLSLKVWSSRKANLAFAVSLMIISSNRPLISLRRQSADLVQLRDYRQHRADEGQRANTPAVDRYVACSWAACRR